MNKYQKLHDLSGWACLAYSEHMVLPAKTIYLLAGEARVLLAERDRLLAKHDRAVELLQRVWGCLGVKGCLSGAEKYLRECGETGPVLKDEVREFLRELGGE